jgi:hypothetical protein
MSHHLGFGGDSDGLACWKRWQGMVVELPIEDLLVLVGVTVLG